MSSEVKVERKNNESFRALLRRFHRRVRSSGKVLEVRKRRFHTKEPNDNQQKQDALRRIRTAKKREYLLKTGQIDKRGNRR
jgi:ribosomal protein S21